MKLLEILTHPNPHLRLVAKKVEKVGSAEKELIKNMFYTMYQSSGIGLAASQVDVQKRIIVIDVSDDKSQPLAIINPQIAQKSGEIEYQEGCLSVPGIYEKITRAEHIQYQGLNEKGEKILAKADGLLAICIQHEIDHLDGKLFVDYLSILKQKRITQKIKNSKIESKLSL